MDIKELREQIDDIDRKLTMLLVKRLDVSAEIAACKLEADKAITDDVREKQVLDNVSSLAGQPYAQYLPEIYTAIMNAGKAYQSSLTEKGATPRLQSEV